MPSQRFCFACLSVLAAILFVHPDSLLGQRSPVSRAQTVDAVVPLGFEPNYGQTGSPIKYVTTTGSLRFELRPEGFDLSTGRLDHERTVLRVDFAGASSTATITASQRLPGETNYFLGRDSSTWHTHIPNFQEVMYSNIYPGIDAVFYRKGKQLEHDFHIAPGADYHRIRMRVDGFHKISSQSDGSLKLSVSGGDVVLRAPDVYQNTLRGRQPLTGRYVFVAKNELGFAIDIYDPSLPLVIDPVLNYETFVSTASFLTVGVATDASGSTYVAGSPASSLAAAVIKLSPSGVLVYASYFGNSCGQYGGIAVDANGDAIVGISMFEPNLAGFPLKNPIPFVNAGSVWYGYVFSLSPDGSSLNYASLIAGSGSQATVMGVALDGAGNAYVSGTTNSPSFPVTPGALNDNGVPPGNDNGVSYVLKLLPNGNLRYSALLGNTTPQNGGGGPTGPMGVAVDQSGSAYVTGSAGSLWPTTNGAYQAQIPGASPYAAPFVSKVSADGSSLVYSTFLGAQANPTGIVVNGIGEAFVTGVNAPSTFPITANAYQQTLPSGQIIGSFFTQLNSSGSGLIYSSFFSGGSNSRILGTAITAIALDTSGDIWLTGTSKDPVFPMVSPLNAVFGSLTNRLPGFVSEFDPTESNLIFSTYIGDLSQGAQSLRIAADPHGDIHVAGVTGSEFYTSPVAYVGSVAAPPANVDFLYGFVTVIEPTVAAPAICIPFPSNEGLLFPSTVVGASNTSSLTIQSCGTVSLTINNIQSSDPNFGVPLGSNGCQKTLQIGASCTVSVIFEPLVSGPLASALTLSSNAPMPIALPLAGTGQIPSPAPYFALGAVPASPSVTIQAPGDASAPVMLEVVAVNGFNGQVTFSPASCSISPAGSLSTCAFTPGSINGSGTTQVVINTTAAGSAKLTPAPVRFPKDWPPRNIELVLIFACCSLAGFAAAKRSVSRIALSVLVIALLGLCQACGGGRSNSGVGSANNDSGTPTGRIYTVTVTATSGQMSQSTNFAFTVQ